MGISGERGGIVEKNEGGGKGGGGGGERNEGGSRVLQGKRHFATQTMVCIVRAAWLLGVHLALNLFTLIYSNCT